MNTNDAAQQARQELLAMHADARAAHFAADVGALMAHQSDDFVYAGNGVIRRLTLDDLRRNISEAFANGNYHTFDDLEPPVIHVSADATMAWMAVSIRVRKTQTDGNGVSIERDFVSAGIRVYEKRGGAWVLTATS